MELQLEIAHQFRTSSPDLFRLNTLTCCKLKTGHQITLSFRSPISGKPRLWKLRGKRAKDPPFPQTFPTDCDTIRNTATDNVSEALLGKMYSEEYWNQVVVPDHGRCSWRLVAFLNSPPPCHQPTLCYKLPETHYNIRYSPVPRNARCFCDDRSHVCTCGMHICMIYLTFAGPALVRQTQSYSIL